MRSASPMYAIRVVWSCCQRKWELTAAGVLEALRDVAGRQPHHRWWRLQAECAGRRGPPRVSWRRGCRLPVASLPPPSTPLQLKLSLDFSTDRQSACAHAAIHTSRVSVV
jgi:hypothetical protein